MWAHAYQCQGPLGAEAVKCLGSAPFVLDKKMSNLTSQSTVGAREFRTPEKAMFRGEVAMNKIAPATAPLPSRLHVFVP
jgi:hypothetical protein